MNVKGHVVAMATIVFGGETIESFLPDNYEGAVKVASASDCGEAVIAVLPNFAEAWRVAAYAMSPDGGYGSVELHAVSMDQVTHADFFDAML